MLGDFFSEDLDLMIATLAVMMLWDRFLSILVGWRAVMSAGMACCVNCPSISGAVTESADCVAAVCPRQWDGCSPVSSGWLAMRLAVIACCDNCPSISGGVTKSAGCVAAVYAREWDGCSPSSNGWSSYDSSHSSPVYWVWISRRVSSAPGWPARGSSWFSASTLWTRLVGICSVQMPRSVYAFQKPCWSLVDLLNPWT